MLAQQMQCQNQQYCEMQQERDALEAVLPRLLQQGCTADQNPQHTSQAADLQGQHILIGGHASQCVHFQNLVEHCNGNFIHHDGGKEEGHQRLGSLLPKADAVLCPLDCISHAAVNRIKRFCKHAATPVVFLPRASLSAFTRGLDEVASHALHG